MLHAYSSRAKSCSEHLAYASFKELMLRVQPSMQQRYQPDFPLVLRRASGAHSLLHIYA